MWTPHLEKLAAGRILKVVVKANDSPLTFSEALQQWQTNAEFRTFFNNVLANCPFSAFRWETPPLTTTTTDRPFEFVLLDSPFLARKPDIEAFADYFRATNEDIASFPNLNNDALLVVPCPVGPPATYGNLAAFVRDAPEQQRHSLWKRVGEVMQQRLSTDPIWLSTAGAGISWLHVRLDNRPKYYGYPPYKDNPTS